MMLNTSSKSLPAFQVIVYRCQTWHHRFVEEDLLCSPKGLCSEEKQYRPTNKQIKHSHGLFTSGWQTVHSCTGLDMWPWVAVRMCCVLLFYYKFIVKCVLCVVYRYIVVVHPNTINVTWVQLLFCEFTYLLHTHSQRNVTSLSSIETEEVVWHTAESLC